MKVLLIALITVLSIATSSCGIDRSQVTLMDYPQVFSATTMIITGNQPSPEEVPAKDDAEQAVPADKVGRHNGVKKPGFVDNRRQHALDEESIQCGDEDERREFAHAETFNRPQCGKNGKGIIEDQPQ